MTSKQQLFNFLVKNKVITNDFIGYISIHIGEGSISDIERHEKGLLRKSLIDLGRPNDGTRLAYSDPLK